MRVSKLMTPPLLLFLFLVLPVAFGNIYIYNADCSGQADYTYVNPFTNQQVSSTVDVYAARDSVRVDYTPQGLGTAPNSIDLYMSTSLQVTDTSQWKKIGHWCGNYGDTFSVWLTNAWLESEFGITTDSFVTDIAILGTFSCTTETCDGDTTCIDDMSDATTLYGYLEDVKHLIMYQLWPEYTTRVKEGGEITISMPFTAVTRPVTVKLYRKDGDNWTELASHSYQVGETYTFEYTDTAPRNEDSPTVTYKIVASIDDYTYNPCVPSAEVTFNVGVDDTSNVLALTILPSDPSDTDNITARVTVTIVEDPVVRTQILVDGSLVCEDTTTRSADYTYECDIGTLPAGDHTIEAKACVTSDCSQADIISTTITVSQSSSSDSGGSSGSSGSPLPTWWNSNWQYRLPITLQNQGSSDLEGYQVALHFDDTAPFWDKVNSDLSDIRFTIHAIATAQHAGESYALPKDTSSSIHTFSFQPAAWSTDGTTIAYVDLVNGTDKLRVILNGGPSVKYIYVKCYDSQGNESDGSINQVHIENVKQVDIKIYPGQKAELYGDGELLATMNASDTCIIPDPSTIMIPDTSDFDQPMFLNPSYDGTPLQIESTIPYWIEEYDSSVQYATIWVRAPYIPANGSTTIYMYYGNPDATSVSDPYTVFDLYDDFDGSSLDTSKWVSSSTSITVENGSAIVPKGGYYIRTTQTFSVSTSFNDISTVPFDAYHEQGIATLGDYYYITTVDTTNDKAYVYKVDSSGNVVASVDVTDGSRYHPSGIDKGDGYLWFAISEYVRTPSNPTLIIKMNENLEYNVIFEVPDHIGAVCYGNGKLYMFNWDAEKLYVYDTSGNLIASVDKNGWGAINGCFYMSGKIYGSSQDDDKLYVIDTNTLSVVSVLDLPSGYGAEGLDYNAGYYIFLPDDGYIHVTKYENVQGWIVDYRVSQAGNRKRNIGFSEAFPCVDSSQNHVIEHAHDGIFEAEVLSANASTPYKESGGSVSTSFEAHTLLVTTNYVKLINNSTGNTITITATEAGAAYPTINGLYLGFQTWGSADNALYVDWVRVYKYADPEPTASFGAEETGQSSDSGDSGTTQPNIIFDISPTFDSVDNTVTVDLADNVDFAGTSGHIDLYIQSGTTAPTTQQWITVSSGSAQAYNVYTIAVPDSGLCVWAVYYPDGYDAVTSNKYCYSPSDTQTINLSVALCEELDNGLQCTSTSTVYAGHTYKIRVQFTTDKSVANVKLYTFNQSDGTETYLEDLTCTVDSSNNYTCYSSEMSFADPVVYKYHVYAYDSSGEVIGAGSFYVSVIEDPQISTGTQASVSVCDSTKCGITTLQAGKQYYVKVSFPDGVTYNFIEVVEDYSDLQLDTIDPSVEITDCSTSNGTVTCKSDTFEFDESFVGNRLIKAYIYEGSTLKATGYVQVVVEDPSNSSGSSGSTDSDPNGGDWMNFVFNPAVLFVFIGLGFAVMLAQKIHPAVGGLAILLITYYGVSMGILPLWLLILGVIAVAAGLVWGRK